VAGCWRDRDLPHADLPQVCGQPLRACAQIAGVLWLRADGGGADERDQLAQEAGALSLGLVKRAINKHGGYQIPIPNDDICFTVLFLAT
jgi:hypothetical protein